MPHTPKDSKDPSKLMDPHKVLGGTKGGLTRTINKLRKEGKPVPPEILGKLKAIEDQILAQSGQTSASEDTSMKRESSSSPKWSAFEDPLEEESPEEVKPSKRLKTSNMLSQIHELKFTATDEPASYHPSTLQVPAVKHQMVTLPITIKAQNGETLQITSRHDPSLSDKCFWTELSNKVKQLEPLLASHQFGPVEQDDLDMLKLGSHLMPSLLGHGGRLLYETNGKEGKIRKADYKTFLHMVEGNVKHLLNNVKTDLDGATQRSPISKHKVAIQLQSGMRGTTLLNVEEHGKVLQAQAAYYLSTVEIIRKELTSFGVALSNLASSTQAQRLEVQALAIYAKQLINKHKPTSEDSQRGNPTTEVELPAFVLRTLESHPCQCGECNPNLRTIIQHEEESKAVQAYENKLTSEVRRELRISLEKKYTAELESATMKEVRAAMREKIQKEELHKYKARLAQELATEWKEKERAKIRAELETEYQDRFKQLFQPRPA